MIDLNHKPNILAALLLTTAIAGCGDDSSEQPTTIAPLDPAEEHFGKSYDEWGCVWWQWVMETPYSDACNYSVLDTDGSQCATGQDPSSEVFFLAGTNSGDSIVRDKCIVPSGKALLFPILNGILDNAGLPPEDAKSDEEVRTATEQYLGDIDQASLFVTVDGEDLSDLASYQVGPIACPYEVPPEPNLYSCVGLPGVVGPIDPAYATGYYILLPPLAAGQHTLRFGGKSSPPSEFQVDVTYELTVE